MGKTETPPTIGFDFDPLTQLIRQAARKALQLAVEEEANTFLAGFNGVLDEQGRSRLVRNGYLPEREIITPIGPIAVQMPRVRDRITNGPKISFESSYVPRFMRKTQHLENYIPFLYLKGVSLTAIGETMISLTGTGEGFSASTVCHLKDVWQDEYIAWQSRDLKGQRFVYLYADGVSFGVRSERNDQCMLVLIGIRDDGTKTLVGLHEGFEESAEDWRELFVSLQQQGLEYIPKLVIGDGGLGLWKALAKVYPSCRAQYCWFHKVKNVLSHLPKTKQAQGKEMAKEIWNAFTREDALKALKNFEKMFGAKFPKAFESIEENKDQLLTFYDFPGENWKHLRTSSPIEAIFATVRLRTAKTRGMSNRETIGAMVFKLCQGAEKNWRKIKSTGIKHLVDGREFKDGDLVEL
jgi:transposase-like protein